MKSAIDTETVEFAQRIDANLALTSQVKALQERVVERSASQRAKFSARGQLLPRERLELLFDPGSECIELSRLAGYRMHDDDGEREVLGGAVIAQIGVVEGVRVMALANDSAIKGGATMPMGLRKYLRAQEIALENRLPVVMLVEAAGGNLNYQAEIFVEGGRRFFNQAKLSAAGVPQIAVVHGSSTAGGAYIPGMSDYTVMVRKKAKVFLAGPPLLKAATGEIADDEDLGGAEMHARVTGTAEFMVDDDAAAVALARAIVRNLAWSKATLAGVGVVPPRFSPDEILGIVPTDYRQPYDVREVIIRLVDASEFLEIKPLFGEHIVCGRGFVEGHSCGFIGNNGPIHADDANKAAQFIQMCAQTRTPIIYLQNTTGFMVGTESEHAGIIKHGAKLIQAVSNAPVPSITFMIGASFGAGNFGMCGRAYGPRFLFSWPNSRMSVMGGEQAATVLQIVAEQKAGRTGNALDQQELLEMRTKTIERINAESSVLYATARIWDDGIVDPRDTRRILGFCLRVCHDANRVHLQPSTYGVARF